MKSLFITTALVVLFIATVAESESTKDGSIQNTENRHFSGFGLSFDYPNLLAIERTDAPVELISLQSTNGITMAVSVYPTKVLSPEQVHKIGLNGFRKATSRTDKSKDRKETDSQRHILGQVREGTTFTDIWSERERISEFYTFLFADGVLSVMLQHFADNSREAASAFDTILKSLKQDAPQPTNPPYSSPAGAGSKR